MPRHDIITGRSGILIEVLNDTDAYMDVNYASVTAPELCLVEVFIGDELFDAVWVGPGASHSWWTLAGGKLLDHNGLDAGQKLTIKSSGECCLRLDWI